MSTTYIGAEKPPGSLFLWPTVNRQYPSCVPTRSPSTLTTGPGWKAS